MAGLDPAIYVAGQCTFASQSGAKRKRVDPRVKPGDDVFYFISPRP